VADGLVAMANRERKRELEQVQCKELDLVVAKEREESKKRQREVDRLHILPTFNMELSSSSDFKDKWLVPKSPVSNTTDLGIDSDSDLDDVEGLGIKADFNIDDAQIIDIGDDLDESVKRFVKHESSEPSNSIEIPKYNPAETTN
jgi:hypothetical protein